MFVPDGESRDGVRCGLIASARPGATASVKSDTSTLMGTVSDDFIYTQRCPGRREPDPDVCDSRGLATPYVDGENRDV
jgi:hypothetical protein